MFIVTISPRNLIFLFMCLFMGGALSWGAPITHNVEAEVRVNNAPFLVLDDWDDGVPPNNLGAPTGSFTSSAGGAASLVIVSTVALGGSGSSLQINYNVSASKSFSGYFTKFNAQGTRDISGYSSLSFYVKGEVGGEFFKIEMSTGAGGWKSRIYINDYLDLGVTTNWQKVTIPLAAFANITSLTAVNEFTLVFEGDQLLANGSAVVGTIYIDQLTLSPFLPEALNFDRVGDAIGVNSLGGNVGSMYGGQSVEQESWTTDTFISAPRSLQFFYYFPGLGWSGVWSLVGGQSAGYSAVSKDFSAYNRLTFQMRAKDNDNNPEIFKLEIEDSKGRHSLRVLGITPEWKKFDIPFSSFKDLDPKTIKQLNFILQYPDIIDRRGYIYIDDIQFRSGASADTVFPATPRNMKIMDKAGGTLVTNGTPLSWINWLTVEADNGIQDPTMASVRFEYSINGTDWTTIGEDFDLADNRYQVFWDTTGLQPGSNFQIRAIARDNAENESILPPLTNLVLIHIPNVAGMTDDEFLDLVQKQMFWYYWKETNPEKGLVQDRARNFAQDDKGITSVAATGMGLVAICIAHSRGWLDTQEAYNRVKGILETYFNAAASEKARDSILVQNHGFYYHFTDFGGARAGTAELSTIDTTLFAAGALFAGQYFKDFGFFDPESIATQIYRRIDWNWMLNGNDFLDWGWTPEGEFNQGEMSGYSEAILAYILGMGAPDKLKRLPSPAGWNSLVRSMNNTGSLKYIFEKSLFTHQYPPLFVNFRGKRDAFASYSANTYAATLHHHRYAVENSAAFKTYHADSWGLGGADHPDGSYRADGVGKIGVDNNGTVALSNLLTAMPQISQQVIRAMRKLFQDYGAAIWGKYTFPDSYNTDIIAGQPFNESGLWRSSDVLGVQMGAALLAIENYRSGLIHKKFMKISHIKEAMKSLGFVDDLTPPGAVTNLNASWEENAILLSWTAPGDDDSTGDITDGIYEIRFSENPSDTWETAPHYYLNFDIVWSTNTRLGENQAKLLLGLPSNKTYSFWIKTYDDSFNESLLSNTTTFFVPLDAAPPAPVADLAAQAENGWVALTWTSPGDDGISGKIFNGQIEIRYTLNASQSPQAAPFSKVWTFTADPGTSQRQVISDLTPSAVHYFWVRTKDGDNNWSNFSNRVSFSVVDPVPPSAINNLAVKTGFQIDLTWTAPGNNGASGTAQKYIVKYSLSNITSEADWNKAIVYSQNWTPKPVGASEAYTLTGLPPGEITYVAIRALDDLNNSGPLSNQAGNSAVAGSFVFHQNIETPNSYTSFAFGDMDNDGDLDLGYTDIKDTTRIYKNDKGQYALFWSVLQSPHSWWRAGAGMAWLDFDRNGYLDFVVVPTWQYKADLYSNTNGTSFSLVKSFLQYDNTDSGLDVADYDNDGDIDIAFTGWGGQWPGRTEIWRNDAGAWTNQGGLGLHQVQFSNLAFGDYDNDGLQDIILRGYVYYSEGNGFRYLKSLVAGTNASLAWGDYDNDGDLDLAIGADVSYIFRNDGKEIFTQRLSVSSSFRYLAAWGDYDNDGDLDILLGDKLYRNVYGTFQEVQTIPGGRRAAWADIDNDGDLDFATSAGLYRNVTAQNGKINAAPLAPTALSASVVNSILTLTWNPGSDAETSTDGLYYAVRLGTKPYVKPGDDNIISGNFGSPLMGNHLRPKISNTQLGRIVNSLPSGTYYWSVQTIDTGLRPSSWSNEQTRTIP